MNAITLVLAVALVFTIVLLIRSLFRQAGIQDTLKETSDSAQDQLKLWEEFGQNLDEGVALVDEHDTVVYANGAFAELTGWAGRSSWNQPLDTVLKLEAEGGQSTVLPDSDSKTISFIRQKEGGRISVSPVRRELHKPKGYSVVVLRDATAERAEKELRKRLVSLSSFELRAPVTAMKGYASMLIEGDAGKLTKEALGYVEPILDSTDKLLTIIDDMAHVEALSTKGQTIKLKTTEVKAFLTKAEPAISKVTKEAGRNLVVSAGQLKAAINIDHEQLVRLVGMLANTAARTSQPKTDITLACHADEKSVEIILENHGDPLPKASQANVFDYAGGHGLDEGIGFYVAKQIIETHQATLSVETRPDGNLFKLRLPRQADIAPPVEKPKVDLPANPEGMIDGLSKK